MNLPTYYDDPRHKLWSQLFRNGDRTGLLASLEQDLQSPMPHVEAAHLWCLIKEITGELDAGLKAVKNEKLKQELGVYPELYLGYKNKQYALLLQKYPPDNVPDRPVVLFRLAMAADNLENYSLQFEYLSRIIQSQPDYSQALTELTNLAISQYHIYPDIRKLCDSLEAGPTYTFLDGILQYPLEWSLQSVHSIILQWLEERPSDGYMRGVSANLFRRREHYPTANEQFKQAFELLPFNDLSQLQAYSLIQQREYTQAHQVLENSKRLWLQDLERFEIEVEISFARALREMGDRGPALDTLRSALAKYPEDGDLLYEKAKLDSAMRHPEAALDHVRQALEQKPDKRAWQAFEIRCLLDLQEQEAAVTKIQPYLDTEEFKSINDYILGRDVYKTFGYFDAWLALGREATEKYPQAIDALDIHAGALGEAEYYDEAIDQLDKALHLSPNQDWILDNLLHLVEKRTATLITHPPVEGSLLAKTLPSVTPNTSLQHQLVLNYRKKYPWVSTFWKKEASFIGEQDTDAQITFWKKAIQANPNRFWPYHELLYLYLNTKQWSLADEWSERAISAVQSGGEGELTDAHWARGWVYGWRLSNNDLTIEAIKQALQIWDKYLNLGGYPNQYHHYRASLLEALGNNEEAQRSRREAASTRPSDRDYIWSLITRDGDAYAFARAHDYLMYDPEDPERLGDLIEMHIKWNGSPLVAFKHLDTLRRVDPKAAARYSFTEGMGWQQLGDAVKSYELRYPHLNSIAQSDRYINWYKSARKEAQQQNTKVEIDVQQYRAMITLPSGETRIRMDHPVLGKPVLLQKGNRWLRGIYDDITGDLIRVETSSGATLDATYYPNGKILSLSTSSDETLVFEHNEALQIKRISLANVGEMRISYNRDNTTRIESDDEGINARIQNLLGMQSRWLSAMHEPRPDLEIPSFLYAEDEELKRRSQRYSELKTQPSKAIDPELIPSQIAIIPFMGKVLSLQIATAKTGLSLARYQGRNMEKSEDYADQARYILQDIFETAVSNRKALPLQDLGVEAVALWHLTILQEKRRELTGDLFDNWNRMHRWLDEVAEQQPDNVLLSNLIRKIEENPLPRLRDPLWLGTWLKKHPVSNPHLWETVSIKDLFPLHDDVQINCVLNRQAGDLLVGSTHGISFRQGRDWVTKGVDPDFSRLQEIQGDGVPINIACLAEDAEGTLWFGTDQGLFAQQNQRLKRWPSIVMDKTRTNQLISLNSGVLAATDSGVDRVTWHDGSRTVTSEYPKFLKSIKVPSRHEENRLSSHEFDVDWLWESDMVESEPAVLVATHDQIHIYIDEELTSLVETTAEDADYLLGEEKLYILHQNTILVADWDGSSKPHNFKPIPEQHTLTSLNDIFALSLLHLDDWGLLAAFHNNGIALYSSGYLPHRAAGETTVMHDALHATDAWQEQWKYAENPSSHPTGMTSSDNGLVIYDRHAIQLFEKRSIIHDTNAPVTDIVMLPESGHVYIARNGQLDAVQLPSPDSIPFLKSFSPWSNTSRLAKDNHGRLISNQGSDIVRYDDPNFSDDATFLFSAYSVYNSEPGSISKIIVDEHDAIWVTCADSVFRWQEGDQSPQQFSIHKNQDIFPARSDMISRILKTYDGHIWVVASDENHRNHRGVPMVGGLLEWNGQAFVRLPIEEKMQSHWFITGYTRINNNLAICGTTSGFIKHIDNELHYFGDLNNESYNELYERTPLLWCGTQGAALSDGTWLFGCAGGVVRYDPATDQWAYPEKINNCLPDHYLKDFGSLAVDALAIDRNDWVYVGTNRGLLMFAWEKD